MYCTSASKVLMRAQIIVDVILIAKFSVPAQFYKVHNILAALIYTLP